MKQFSWGGGFFRGAIFLGGLFPGENFLGGIFPDTHYTKNVLLNRIEHEHMSCDAGLVTNGRF